MHSHMRALPLKGKGFGDVSAARKQVKVAARESGGDAIERVLD